MKTLLTATLPALALLALGGCATSGALTTSTETDGVYYSSSDHTTAATPSSLGYGNTGTIPARALDDTTPATAATTDDANPDYQGGTSSDATAGTDYYSNNYNMYSGNGFGQPYTGPGVSNYNYAPAYNGSPSYYGSPFGYSSAFGYGYSPFGYGYSPFMSYGYSPFGYGYPYGGYYDPFYSPYGYGSSLSIGFGYGFGGFGGYGYSPFGYGYGSPYGYSPFYGRGYAYGADYSNRSVIYTRGAGINNPGPNSVLYGSRSNRGGAVMSPNAVGNANAGGRPGSGSYTGNAVAIPGGANAPVAAPTGRSGRAVSFGGDATGQPTYSTPASPAATGNATPQTAPGGGRRGFFSGFFGNGAGGGSNANAAGQPATAGQPANAGSYGSRQRNYGQPSYNSQSQAQRTYSQPQMQQRSYSQPTYSQPSYSQPSRSFGGGSYGGGGGGSFGGGGGGGGGGRGRR